MVDGFFLVILKMMLADVNVYGTTKQCLKQTGYEVLGRVFELSGEHIPRPALFRNTAGHV